MIFPTQQASANAKPFDVSRKDCIRPPLYICANTVSRQRAACCRILQTESPKSHLSAVLLPAVILEKFFADKWAAHRLNIVIVYCSDSKNVTALPIQPSASVPRPSPKLCPPFSPNSSLAGMCRSSSSSFKNIEFSTGTTESSRQWTM